MENLRKYKWVTQIISNNIFLTLPVKQLYILPVAAKSVPIGKKRKPGSKDVFGRNKTNKHLTSKYLN